VRTDLELICVVCNRAFWWTAGEQAFYAARGFDPPKRCPACRGTRITTSLSPPAPRQTALAVRPEVLPAPTPTIDRNALFADIRELLVEAATPLDNRGPNFLEALFGIDPVAEQVAKKNKASQTAAELARERTVALQRLQELLVAASTAEVARIEARTRLLRAQLEQQRLEEQLARRDALAAGRLETRLLKQRVEQEQLRRTTHHDENDVERQRRANASASRVRQRILDDFFRELDAICRAPASLREKAIRIRQVMAAFELDEEALTDDARWVLATAEKL
jgi:hypothetical protein